MSDKAPRFTTEELEKMAVSPPLYAYFQDGVKVRPQHIARALLAEREERRLDVETLRDALSWGYAVAKFSDQVDAARARLAAWEKEGRE